MDALVLAGGGVNPADPIYQINNKLPKSLTPIAGKPMVQWVLDALSGAASINQIFVIGLDESSGLTSTKPLTYLPEAGSIFENIINGAAYSIKANPEDSHLLTVSSGLPTLTSPIIDFCIQMYGDLSLDIYYAVIERETMEKRFPGSKRTYIKVKDAEICGGDANCIRKEAALNPDGIWTEIIRQRKNPLKQASIIGWGTLFGLLLGTLTLDEAVQRVCKRLGISGKAIIMPYAEIGMDVDKPFQHKIVEEDLLRVTN